MIERWLITGASGQLGGHLLRDLDQDPAPKQVFALTRGREIAQGAAAALSIPLDDLDALARTIRGLQPTHVLHTGAMTAVSDCFQQPDLARRINTDATCVLSEMACDLGARFVFTSTDMVFDGQAAPYREGDPPAPLSCYGRTKADAERAMGQLGGLVVRIPLLFGFPCTDRPTTFAQQIAALRTGQPLKLFTDEFRTPLWLGDAAAALVALARSRLTGIIHVAGPERLSRYELVARCAKLLAIPCPQLEPVSRLSVPSAEPRPADLSLDGSLFAAQFPRDAPGRIRLECFTP